MAGSPDVAATFHIGPRYIEPTLIGGGAYGTVVQAVDTTTSEKVAIKKLNKLEDIIDAKRNLREIRCMRCLRHENVLGLKDVIYHKESQEEEIGEIYLVTELLDTDLHRIIKTNQPLTDEHAQYFLYQLLKALKYIQSANIVHRDIKPSNILVNADCDLKICDFGLSRSINDGLEDLTEYVVTRFYRAPEIMLSSHEYTNAIDVWSVGCTLGELIARRVLFPGANYIKQIEMIVRALGTPTSEDIEFIANPHAKKFIMSLERKEKITMSEFIGVPANQAAIDLLEKMLNFNPNNRISVEEALGHPYLAELRDEEEEVSFTETIDFEFEKQNVTFEDAKKMLIQEIELCQKTLSESS